MDRFPIKLINIIQAGCGGTGGWLSPMLAKMMRSILLRSNKIFFRYFLYDPDIVEEKNILRQNFDYYDLCKYKVEAMHKKILIMLNNHQIFSEIIPYNHFNEYSQVYDLGIDRFDHERKQNMLKISKLHDSIIDQTQFYENMVNQLLNELGSMRKLIDSTITINILIGCVDNLEARQVIYEKFTRLNDSPLDDGDYPFIHLYIDSGNDLDRGQIISFIYSNILDNEELTKRINSNVTFSDIYNSGNIIKNDNSCAVFGDQSMSTNIMAANLLFAQIQKFIIHNELPAPAIYFQNNGKTLFTQVA